MRFTDRLQRSKQR